MHVIAILKILVWEVMKRYSCMFLYMFPVCICTVIIQGTRENLIQEKCVSSQSIKMAVHKDFGLTQHTTHLDMAI